MKKMKRILAIMLCLTMAISGPLSVFAEETNTVVEEKCSECGSMDGHTEECSQYVPTEPEAECNCEAVDEKHAETCPKYTVPEDNQTTNEESELVVESCTECGSTEGHTAECSLYAQIEKESIYKQLFSANSLAEMSQLLLIASNESLETLMNLSIEEIFLLIAQANALYEKDPTEENAKILDEEIILVFTYLPNYREKCIDCGEYPCICEISMECNCGATEDEIHNKGCNLYYKSIYDFLMHAETVNKFGEVSCTLNEIETTLFREWLKENDLLQKFDDHADKLLNNGAHIGQKYVLETENHESRDVADVSNAVKLSKSATYNSTTGLYDIVLESYTTGVIEEGQVLPADTVLVLDTSGSMAYDYTSTRIGIPMFGDYFKHPSGNYWGWYENNHLINNENPYVLLPDGNFARAKYYTTDDNNVEIFQVVDEGTYKNKLFYPKMQTDNLTTVPRQYTDYPVYQLYSSKEENTYTVTTGVPIYGNQFEYNGTYYYGWLGNSHGEPYVRLEDGNFGRAYYSRTDANKIEIFKYNDSDTGAVYEFYPRLTEKDNDVKRAENLPIVQLYSGYNKTRMAALHDAVAEFLRLTAKNNSGVSADAQSRVSIVQFSCDQHGGPAPTKVVRELTSITLSNVDEWIELVYGITDGGLGTHTEIGEGMLLAENILSLATRTSHKAVIAFTDGKPECDATSGGGFSYIETNKAIEAANRMTQNYNADIYSICIQGHAKVNEGASLPPDEGKGVNDDKNNINRFMHLMSSNYPDATNMTNTGSGSTNAGYYMVPGADNDLVSIFTHIGDQIGNATIDLGASTMVLDYVTPYFQIPENASVDISVQDADYSNGTLQWKASSMNTSGINYSINQEEKSVKVTGFDYNHNFVASQGRIEGDITKDGEFYGRKLIIKFSIDENDDFLGGDDVVTNESNSGIYTGSDMVSAFDIPEVDVPISKIVPLIDDKDIYLSQQAPLPEVINLGKFEQNGGNWSVDGINNAYVDVVYTLKDSKGKFVTYTIPAGTGYSSLSGIGWDETGGLTTHPILKEDMTYQVSIKTVSKTDGSNLKETEDSATISVYKPEATFKDSVIILGNTADYEKENYVNVIWRHATEGKANVEVMGKAPDLEYLYSPEAAAFTQDTNVKVEIVAKKDQSAVPQDMNITQYTTFYRDICDYKDCEHKKKTSVSAEDSNRINFIIHINRFDLTIQKTGCCDQDENQTFVFSVKKDNQFLMNVTIVGNGEITIKDLPVGNYTVEELEDWSWRYDAKDNSQSFGSDDIREGKMTLVFENNRNDLSWMDGSSHARNIFAPNSISSSGNIYQEGGN